MMKKDMIRSEKAVSEVIGMVMLISIMMLAIGGILLFGVPMIESGKDRARMDVAANSFLTMQNDIEEVVRGPIWITDPYGVKNVNRLGPSRETEFELMGGTLTVLPNSSGITYKVAGYITHSAPSKSLRTAIIPDDPAYAQQWSLQKIAWDQAYGNISINGSVKLAILDTGVDATHPDLAGRTIEGKSFVNGDPGTDPNGHGTAMAGIAAALVNNSAGMAGVSYANTGIMSVQVLQANGTGYDKDVVAGVLWAADNGANVILMAFSSSDYSASLNDAITYAWKKGVVIVAATGNDGSTGISYPAGMANVIGVASTDKKDELSSDSNTGSASVAAPGLGIYTTLPGGGYGSVSGTSAASAHVAGLAALLAANGSDNRIISNQIRGAIDPVSGQSFGRINVEKALRIKFAPLHVPAITATPMPGVPPTYIVAVPLISLSPTSGPVGTTVSVTGSGFTTASPIIITFNGVPKTTIPNPCVSTSNPGGGNFICSFIVPTISIGSYTVTATDSAYRTDSKTFTVGGTLTVVNNISISPGNITYSAEQESIIYENGAVIRKYEGGNPLMISDPLINIYDTGDGKNITVSIHAITLNGTLSSTGGDGKAYVETRLENYSEVIPPSSLKQTNITIFSKYPEAWRTFFDKKLKDAGLVSTNKGSATGYNISNSGTPLEVQIYGKSGTTKDIFLSIYWSKLDVKVR
jgi:thermitase